MPRIVRVVENIILVKEGQLPAPSSPFWYSGRGSDAPTLDGGGLGGTPPEGQGLAVAGLHADLHALHLVVDGWDAGATGVEVTVELNRAPGGTLEWAALDRIIIDAGGSQVIKPFRAQILKSDAPVAGQALTVHVPLIAQRLRWGVRALGTAGVTAVHAAYEIIRQVD